VRVREKYQHGVGEIVSGVVAVVAILTHTMGEPIGTSQQPVAFESVGELLSATAARLAQPPSVLDKWAEILHANLYDSCLSIAEINADEWAAMKLPMRARTVIRMLLGPMIEQADDLAMAELFDSTNLFSSSLSGSTDSTVMPPSSSPLAYGETARSKATSTSTSSNKKTTPMARSFVIPAPPTFIPPVEGGESKAESDRQSRADARRASLPAHTASGHAVSTKEPTSTDAITRPMSPPIRPTSPNPPVTLPSGSSGSKPLSKATKQRSFLSFERFRQSSDETILTASESSELAQSMSNSHASEDSSAIVSPRDDDDAKKSRVPKLARTRSLSKLLNLRDKLDKSADLADSPSPSEAESEKFSRVLNDVRELKKVSARSGSGAISVVGDTTLVNKFLDAISHSGIDNNMVSLCVCLRLCSLAVVCRCCAAERAEVEDLLLFVGADAQYCHGRSRNAKRKCAWYSMTIAQLSQTRH
jgi:hypothetical protein